MNERTIFLEALEQPTPESRDAYVQEACGQDTELNRKVSDLLRAHNDAGSFIEHSPIGPQTTDSPGEAAQTDRATAEQPGDHREAAVPVDVNLAFLSPSDDPRYLGMLGTYQILEVIGRGAFGIVLRAFDVKLNRVVAIKALLPDIAANAMSVRRFLKEAQAAAAVSHDHIVTIHAVDDSTTTPYLVMECILGQSLQHKIDKTGALPVAEILRIGMQIASGLSAAHKHGLVHRDIKPGNILLENGIQRVKITDFGLARAVEDLAATQTVQVAGTPQYMSPEQASGQAIDQSSDLFSLGSVLYTMCAGRPAFRADSIMGTLKRVCDDVPRPVRDLNPEIPPWLAATVSKLMAKKPQDRYRSAEEVAELLQDQLAYLQRNHDAGPLPIQLPAAATKQQPSVSKSWGPLAISIVILGILALPIMFVVAGATYFLGFASPPAEGQYVALQGDHQLPLNQVTFPAQFDDDPSTAPWIDLLKSDEVRYIVDHMRGGQWKEEGLELSSQAEATFAQITVTSQPLRNARMRLKARVRDFKPLGSVKLGWEFHDGSPRRYDAIAYSTDSGARLFALWEYDQDFRVTRRAEQPISIDWSEPFTMTCEVRGGQFTAQIEGIRIQAPKGLPFNRPFFPFVGVNNTTWTILEWQVQDLDAE